MFKRAVITLIGAMIMASAVLAEVPSPESATLYFYWVTGEVTNPQNLGGRPVTLFVKTFDPVKSITAEVKSDGSFRLNLGELYYYHKEDNYYAEKGISAGPYYLAVVRTQESDWGTMEAFTLDYREGFKTIKLTLVERGGPIENKGVLSGYVYDDSVPPNSISGALVTVEGLGVSITDNYGNFMFDAVTPGTYRVNCGKENYMGSSEVATVEANKVTTLYFFLQSLTPKGTIEGVVKDTDGKLVAGATIEVDGTPRATTGSDGSYKIEKLLPGTYNLRAVASGYQTSRESTAVGPGETKKVDFTLIPLPEGSAEVWGYVRDFKGNNLSNAVVSANGYSTTTSDNGYSLILPAGSYKVTASLEGYNSQSQDITLTSKENKRLDFTLSISGTSGKIYGWVSSEAHVPIGGAEVTDGRRTASTNLSGSYELIVPPGSYNLHAIAYGYLPGSGSAVVRESEDVNVNFILSKLSEGKAAVCGYVSRSDTGKALSGAYVSAGGTQVTTDGYGWYQMVLDAGTYEVKASKKGYWEKSKNVSLSSQEVLRLDFALDPRPLTIETTSLPKAYRAYYYSADLEASGGEGSYTWGLKNGALPGGLTLEAGGRISGTPQSNGLYTFEVQVTDEAQNLATKWLTLEVTTIEAPSGTVPLNISREGKNIKLSWDKGSFPNPKIYFMTGSGQGEFRNTFDENVWKDITNSSDFDLSYYSSSDGYVLHLNQVGGGSPEAYYKAVFSSVDPSTPQGAATFASAWAVGKVNYTFEPGNNYFNYPFVNAADINTVFGTSGFTNLSKILDYQKSTDKFKPSTFNTTWQDPFVLQLGKGYVFFNYGTTSITVTLVGQIATEAVTFSSNISLGNNYIGLPFPVKKTLQLSFGSNPLKNDGFLIYQRSTDKFLKKSCSKDGAFDDPNFEMNPMMGYVYFRYSGQFLWQPRP